MPQLIQTQKLVRLLFLCSLIGLFSNSSFAQTYEFASPVNAPFNLNAADWNNEAVRFQFADFDGDGDADCFVADINDKCDVSMQSHFFYYENIGNAAAPNYVLDTSFSFESSMDYAQDMIIWDINNDGDLDILFTGEANPFCDNFPSGWAIPAHVYLHNIGDDSNPVFTTDYFYNLTTFAGMFVLVDTVPEKYVYFYDGAIEDVNNDGKKDMIGTTANSKADQFNLDFYDLSVLNVVDTFGGGANTCMVGYDDVFDSIVDVNHCGQFLEYNPTFLDDNLGFSLVDGNGDELPEMYNYSIVGDSIVVNEQINSSSDSTIDFSSKVTVEQLPIPTGETISNVIFADIDNDADADAFAMMESGELYFYENVLTTTINNLEQSTIAIYPNPTNDYFQIRARVGVLRYAIYDMQGRLVQEAMANSENPISVALLDKGVYMIEVELQQQKRFTQLLVKE